MEERGLSDYLGFLRRRRRALALGFGVVFGGFLALALLLPPVYRSTATILVEEQEVPPELVRTTVTGYLEERLQAISQRIMSRSQLLEIIDRFNLYPDLRRRYTVDEIVERMREDIKLETISAEVPLRRAGRPTGGTAVATIAFTLSFEGRDPQLVQQVASYLASLYLRENLRERESKARETRRFLEQQVEEMRRQLTELDQRIAAFKKEHFEELPEMAQLNLQRVQRLEAELERIDDRLATLQERKAYLEGQLATVHPYTPLIAETGERVLTPEDRLEILRTQYLTLSATLSPKHPDLIQLKRQIESLEKEVALRRELAEKLKQLDDLRARLADARGRFSERHPDVRRLRRQVAALEKEVSEARQRLREMARTGPDNPAYVNLSTQIRTTELEIKDLRKQRADLERQLARLRERLARTPEVEREYQELLRQKEAAEANYRELMDKLAEARAAERLEESQKGERFTLIDPPQLPERPCKPNRLALLLVGAVLGVGTGLGSASVAEYLDRSVRGPQDVEELDVLATIPCLETEEERAARRRRKRLLWCAVLLGLAAALLAVHLWVIPLDVAAWRVWQRLTW